MALGKHNVRVQALAETDRARARQRAGRAGASPTCPRAASTRRPRTCAFPARSPCPTRPSRRSLESAARSFRLHGFRDIVFLGDHGGYQKDLQGRRRARSNREWAATPVRVARDRRVLPRRPRPTYAQALQEPRATATTRSARTPGSPTRRSRSPSTRASCAPTSCSPPRRRHAPTASTAIRAARAPSSGKLGVDADRRAHGRRDPQARPRGADRPTVLARRPSIHPSGSLVMQLAPHRSCAVAVVALGLAVGALGRGAGPARRRRAAAPRGRHRARHAAGARPGQSLQRDRRRQDEPGRRRRPARASTCRNLQSNDVYVIDPATLQGRRQVQGRPQSAARRAVVGPAHAVGRQQRREHARTAA